MKKSFLISCILLALSVSCTNQIELKNQEDSMLLTPNKKVTNEQSILPTYGEYFPCSKESLYFIGENHNYFLRVLQEQFYGQDLDLQRVLDFSIEFLNNELLLSGHEILNDEEIHNLTEILTQFYDISTTTLDVVATTTTMIESLPMNSFEKDVIVELINSVEFESDVEFVESTFYSNMLLIEDYLLQNDEYASFLPWFWCAQSIYQASLSYWTEYCYGNSTAEGDDEDEDEDTGNDSDREENLKVYRCTVVDAIGAFAASTTGVGFVLSSIVSGTVSFLWAEAVEPMLAE